MLGSRREPIMAKKGKEMVEVVPVSATTAILKTRFQAAVVGVGRTYRR